MGDEHALCVTARDYEEMRANYQAALDAWNNEINHRRRLEEALSNLWEDVKGCSNDLRLVVDQRRPYISGLLSKNPPSAT